MEQNQELYNLVERAKHGDNAAFEELYSSAYRTVYFTCNGYLKHPQEAEDVTQEVFIHIYNKLNTLENNLTFYGWAKTIAMHLSLNRIRDTKNHASFDDAIANDEILEGDDNLEILPDTYIIRDETRKIIENIIYNELSDVQYQTVFMHYFNEVPVEEIAKIMNCPVGTVKTRLKSARVKIKSSIEQYEQKSGNRLFAMNTIPSIAAILRHSAESISVPYIPFAGFTGGAGVGASTGVTHGSKAANTAAKAGKAGKAVTTAAKASAKGVVAKAVGSIAAVAVICVGAIAIAKLADDKKDYEPTRTSIEEVEGQENASSSNDDNSPTSSTPTPMPLKYDIGSKVTVGSYYGEDITWIVLDAKDGNYLLISESVLKISKYEDDWNATDVTWETCSLRKWLNGNFCKLVFSDEEREGLVSTLNSQYDEELEAICIDKNGSYNPGEDTVDNVFILSRSEFLEYFQTVENGLCDAIPSAYTNMPNATYYWADEETINPGWWLRNSSGTLALVSGLDHRPANNEGMAAKNTGVRPAIWIAEDAITPYIET